MSDAEARDIVWVLMVDHEYGCETWVYRNKNDAEVKLRAVAQELGYSDEDVEENCLLVSAAVQG